METSTRSKDGLNPQLGVDLPVSALRAAVATQSTGSRHQLPGALQRPQTSPQPHHGSHSSLSTYANLLAASHSKSLGASAKHAAAQDQPQTSFSKHHAYNQNMRPGTGSSSALAPHTPDASHHAASLTTSQDELNPDTASQSRPASSDTYSSTSALSSRPNTAECGASTAVAAKHSVKAALSSDTCPAVVHTSMSAPASQSLGGTPEDASPTGRHLLQVMQQDGASAVADLQAHAALSLVPATADATPSSNTVEPAVQTLLATLLPSRSGALTPSHKHVVPNTHASKGATGQDTAQQAEAQGAACVQTMEGAKCGDIIAGLPAGSARLPQGTAGLHIPATQQRKRLNTHSAGPLSPSRPACLNSRRGAVPGAHVSEQSMPVSAWSAEAVFRPRTVPVGRTRQQYTSADLPPPLPLEHGTVTKLASSMHTTKTPVQPLRGVFMDLLEATRKSFAAGMGEWHLQELDWINPDFKSRILQGDIGPEALKAHYGLQEADVLRLYRVLYLYSFGFCAAVLEPTERARNRAQLLEAVFKAYASLWDEALGISFQSEMADVLRTKTDAVAAMKVLSVELQNVKQEHAELQQRMSQFVRSNIDNMLAYKQLQDRAATTQGEVTMLASTNDRLSVKLVGAELAKEEAGLQINTATKRQAAAEAQVQNVEAALSKAKAALHEQQIITTKYVQQIKGLEEQLKVSKQETLSAQKETRLLEAQLDAEKVKHQGIHEQLADKARSYTMLHANWRVKDQELTALREANEKLQAQVQDMRDTHATAKQQICEAKASEQMYCCKWELSCKQLEDVTETNKKLVSRNVELVRSYWPLVARMREAEERAATLQVTAHEATAVRDTLQAQVDAMTRRLDAVTEDAARLHAAQQDLASNNTEVPQSALQSLPPDVAVRVHAYLRAARQRIEELTQQLVQLVDVQASSAFQLQQADACSKELARQLAAAQQELADTTTRLSHKLESARAHGVMVDAEPNHQKPGDGGFDVHGHASSASGTNPESTQMEHEPGHVPASLRVDLQDAQSAARSAQQRASAAEAQVIQLTSQLDVLRAESESKDRWVQEAATQAEQLSARMTSFLLQDPSIPPSAAQVLSKPSSASAAGCTANATLSDLRPGSAQRTCQSLGVATGPIAAALKLPCETRPALVRLDAAWAQLSGAATTLVTWSQDAMDKKTQLEFVVQLQSTADEANSRASKAEQRAQELQQQLQDAEERVASVDRNVAEAAAAVKVIERRADTAAAAESLASEDAQRCRLELTSLQQKHVLMEEEYWDVKTKLLEVQLREAGLKAAHDQATQDAQRASEDLARAHAEATEQRAVRQQLETDIVGLKAWIRAMQQTEVSYRELLMEHSSAKEELEVCKASTSQSNAGEEHLRQQAANAAEASRKSQLACLELQSKLAEALRAVEAGESALRHAREDQAYAEARAAQAAQQAALQRQRADELGVQLLNAQLRGACVATERGIALGALVDARLQASLSQTGAHT